jgi:hypothetical protein
VRRCLRLFLPQVTQHAWATPFAVNLTAPGTYTLWVTLTDDQGDSSGWTGTVLLTWPPFAEAVTCFDGNAPEAVLAPHSDTGAVTLDGVTSRVRVELGLWLLPPSGATGNATFYSPTAEAARGAPPGIGPWFFAFNSTQWGVFSSPPYPIALDCGSSSVCWLRGLFAPGTLTLHVGVGVGAPQGGLLPSPGVAVTIVRANVPPQVVVGGLQL